MTLTLAPAAKATARRPRNTFRDYFFLELRRTLKNRRVLFFSIIFPVFLFFIMKSTQTGFDLPVGHATAGFLLMLSMAVYGAVNVSATQTAQIAAERSLGWMRTLALTRLSTASYLAAKIGVALCLSVVPIVALSVIGRLDGVTAETAVWFEAGALCLTAALIAGLMGLALGLYFNSEMIVRYMGMATTIMAFIGNLFMPLSGTMLTIAKFTPLFGAGMLARYPAVVDGHVFYDDTVLPLWQPIANLVVWSVLFFGFAVYSYRRGLQRQ